MCIRDSLKKALRDAEALVAGGADGCVVQTIDQIYSVGPEVDPARLSSFATIVNEVSKQSPASFTLEFRYCGMRLKHL